ncbi:uncharacterized protein MELLADRAFT_91311 [Melampsora larici-populina 98AG31]|uniref:Uncharacterized protein n=1 Tax=Melampsora larici-populina (strain 98AG31 / pathotype 3-4-7) TaxID=747676 RepID=F4RYK9_MELLP|nr:uncharacterized protein MELLADRAFT_91311 [Melampsora larici-populina 98AG31]EGG02491.1 hypothetical protein MELLADRAFT_91311 [Melampsora larici-populina 98AG31]
MLVTCDFERMALDLLEPIKPGGLTLKDKFDAISRLFPKAKAWIDWWNTADIHAMLFCSRERLPLDDLPLPDELHNYKLPDTTNGQESRHQQYYILTSGNCTIIQGFIQPLLFVESLKKDYHQLLRGIPVKYGLNWDSVVETMGWSKERTRRRPKFNNEQAPNMTEALLAQESRPTNRILECQPKLALFVPILLGKQRSCLYTSVGRRYQGQGQVYHIQTHPALFFETFVRDASIRSYQISTVSRPLIPSFSYSISSPGGVPPLAGQHFSHKLIRDYQCSQYDGYHQESDGLDNVTVKDFSLPARGAAQVALPTILIRPNTSLGCMKGPVWISPHHLYGVAGLKPDNQTRFMDDGQAQLLGCNLDLMSGAQPSTSWLIYQQKPTTEEQKIIDAGIAKITAKNPDALGDVPFVSANDSEGMQDQIDEDSPPSNVASIETGPINAVKQAFTSLAIKTENDSQATKIPAPPPNAPATNKARRAFVSAVNTEILESSQLVANSHLDNGFDDDLSGQEDLKALSPPANSWINNPPTQRINPSASISGPEPKEPIQESIKLRFSIK